MPLKSSTYARIKKKKVYPVGVNPIMHSMKVNPIQPLIQNVSPMTVASKKKQSQTLSYNTVCEGQTGSRFISVVLQNVKKKPKGS
jgi:hypothetical protein